MNSQGKKSFFAENKVNILELVGGVIFFAAGMIIHHFTNLNFWVSGALFIIAYLILGFEIIWKALKNLFRGQLFDENFLMSVATIAAFCIGEFSEAVGVMLFYRVGEFFEDVAVDRSRAQIMDAVDMRPEVVNLLPQGSDSGPEDSESQVTVIPAEQAKEGDLLLIRPGDRIPLDGTIVDGESRLDTSPVTGEPVPRKVEPGDEVISGCVNEQGVLKMRVDKPLSESMVTRILNSVENAEASKPQMDRFITRFSRIYTPVVVVIAILTAIIPSLITGNWYHWVYTAVEFLVISCPCALVLSVPLAFFSGIGAASRRGILFKGGTAIEALEKIRAVVMDKTGTVTKGDFVVRDVITYGRLTPKQILNMAADCEQNSTHPIGVSILQAAREMNLQLVTAQKVEEISGKGIKAVFPEGTLLCGNEALLEMEQVDMGPYQKGDYGTEVLLALNGKLEGCVTIADEIKDDAVSAVSRMKKQGLTTVMLTGDAVSSAQAVAQQTGIEEAYGQLLPEDKLEHLQKIREHHGPVMFVGDGINDAPVLAGADVGAAMGSGADAAIEAADVVFMNSSVDAIPQAMDIARFTGRIATENVVIALVIKALIMILGFLGFASLWLAVFADTGVAMLCVLNSVRILWHYDK